MNPESKACSRPEGPDCKYLVGPPWSFCTNTTCILYPGQHLGKGWGGIGVTDCSYYEPETGPAQSIKWGINISMVLIIILIIWTGVILCS